MLQLRAIWMLCERGATVDAAAANGTTALINAAITGHLDVVRHRAIDWISSDDIQML